MGKGNHTWHKGKQARQAKARQTSLSSHHGGRGGMSMECKGQGMLEGDEECCVALPPPGEVLFGSWKKS